MNTRKYPITAAVLFLILMPVTAWADVLLLKNGKELKVERAWQDSDQICFILQGLKVSIPQSKVSRIESDTNDPGKSMAPVPDQIRKTAESVSTAQPQSSPPGKALVLGQDGFGDLKWGARLAAVRDLEKRQTDSGLEDVLEYVRPADVLKLGDAALTTVVYAFWRERLYTVSVWTEGPANYMALRDAVFKQFGKGIQIGSAGERYLWSNSLTDVMLKYETDDQFGMLWLRGKDLDRKVKLTELSSPTSYLKWMKSRK